MKIVRFYSVQVMSDCEGRGPFKTVARFFTKSDADRFSKTSYGLDMYNFAGCVVEEPITIYENLNEAIDENKDLIKKKALAKLSQKEREALGLSK